MSGVGGGSGGGGGGTGGASDDVAQGLDEVRAKIEKLDAVRNKLEVGSDAWTAVTKELAGLQEEKNQLRAEQQQRELQQQPQTGECCASRLSSLFPVTVQGDPCGEFITCVSLLTAVLCFVRFQFVHQGRPQSGASSHR